MALSCIISRTKSAVVVMPYAPLAVYFYFYSVFEAVNGSKSAENQAHFVVLLRAHLHFDTPHGPLANAKGGGCLALLPPSLTDTFHPSRL